MRFKMILITFLACVSYVYTLAEIEDPASGMKGYLARLLFVKDAAKRGSQNVSVEYREVSSRPFNATQPGLFRSEDEEHYIYDWKTIRLLNVQPGSMRQTMLIKEFKEIGHKSSPCLQEMTSWRNSLVLASCYTAGFCDILTSKGEGSFEKRQSIDISCIARQVKFFTQEEKLFMIVVSDSSALFQWTNNYFDYLEGEILTSAGAKNVDIFPVDNSTVIILNQGSTHPVYLRKQGKTRLIQNLYQESTTHVKHYQLDTQYGPQNFLIALTEDEESPTYWWNGRKFSTWSSIKNFGTPENVYFGTINFEPFLFVTAKNYLNIYHTEPVQSVLVRAIQVEGDILSLSTRDPHVILLVKKCNSDHQIIIIRLNVKIFPQRGVSDSLTDCIKIVMDKIEQRGRILDALSAKGKRMIRTDKPANLTSVKVNGTAFFNDIRIGKLTVDPGKKLLATPMEIREQLQDIKSSLEVVEKRILTNVNYEVENLTVDNLFIDHLTVKKINGREMSEFLSLSKNQLLVGSIKAATIFSKKLEAESLNEKSTNDLLRKSSQSQEINGSLSAKNITAARVNFAKSSKINGLEFGKLARIDSQVVAGIKEVDELVVENLTVANVNNERTKYWIQKTIPSLSKENDKTQLDTDILRVENLTLEFVNGMPWKEYLQRQRVQQDMKVRNLQTQFVNGIPVKNLWRVNDNQTLTSNITTSSAVIETIHFGKVNNLSKEQVMSFLNEVMFTEANSILEVRFSRPVKVTGDFNVTNINFESTLRVNGSVSDLKNFTNSEGSQKTARPDLDSEPDLASDPIDKIIIHGDALVEDKLEALKVNGIDIEELGKILNIDGIVSSPGLQFDNLELGRIVTSTLNGIPLQTERGFYLTVQGKLTVPLLTVGRKNLPKQEDKAKMILKKLNLTTLHIHGSAQGFFNGKNISQLSESLLSKSRPQTISGNYSILNLRANRMTAEELNGISMQNLLYTDVDHHQTIFSQVQLENVGFLSEIQMNALQNCNLSILASIDLKQLTYIDSLEVAENLTWKRANYNPSEKGLSYILNNVVVRGENQFIHSPVNFVKDVKVQNLKTKNHINGIDLDFINGDAVSESLPLQIITSEIGFRELYANKVIVEDDLSVDVVDGVDIMSLNETLVRKSEGKLVTGQKIFSKGVITYELNVADIHGVNPSQFVHIEDFMGNESETRFLPPTTFQSLIVVSTVDVENLNGQHLDDFINRTFSLTSDQTVETPFIFNGNLLFDELNVSRVNDVDLEELILCSGEKQIVDGNLEFTEPLRINGEIDVLAVNGDILTGKYEKSIKVDENSTIEGNVIFSSGLSVRGNLNVSTINHCNIQEVYEKFHDYRPRYVISAMNQATIDEVTEINAILNERKKSKIFKYMDLFSAVDLKLENVKSTSAIKYNEDYVQVQVYGMDDYDCGLPPSCLCPKQFSLDFTGSEVSVKVFLNRNYKYFDKNLNLTIDVTTTSKSYSSRCQVLNDAVPEMTEIKWEKDNGESGKITLEEGYLSDVKFFRLGTSIFIVTAFFYKTNETGSPRVFVHELQTEVGLLSEINAIDARGAISLEVVWAKPSYILVIGNVRPVGDPTESVYSEIYFFNEQKNKFEWKKRIRTHEIWSLKAMRIMEESFIFIIQKYPWPLLSYKYSRERENYYFSEKLYQKSGFLSVNPIPMSETSTGDTYVGVVYTNGIFTIFKYKHVEGLVEEITVKQEGVQFLQAVFVGDEEYLFAVSSAASTYIYRVIGQVG